MRPFRCLQIFIKPRHRLIEAVDLVFRLHEHVTFAGINNKPGRHSERLERVPEFVGLRGGTFGIVLTDDDQGWRFHLLNELNR